MEAFWQRLDLSLRAAIPSISAVLLTLLSVSAWPLPYLGPVRPVLGFIALFYWAAHNPALFPPVVAFAVGLMNDSLNGWPLGLSALLFVGAHQVICRRRTLFAGHSFLLLWFGFALAAALLMFVQWILMGLLRWQVTPFLPVLLQALLTIVLFPLLCWIFIQLQRTVLGAN
jgi:rod shape-determining protein MreD